MRCYPLLVLLCFVCIHTVSAQTHAPSSFPDYPKFYIGVSGMRGNYEVIYPRIRSYDEDVLSVGLTGGYQFASRAAVQISVEKSRTLLEIEIAKPVGTSQTRDSYFRDERHNFAVPVMLRLTGTKKPANRLQFDALAGFVVIHASYDWIQNGYDDQQNIISHEEHAEQTTNVALSIGGGVRYRFGRRIEAVADANLNRTIGAAAGSGFVNVYTVGLRYRFGYQ